MQFIDDQGALVCRRQGETLRIEAWGADSFRVRATMLPGFSGENRALTEAPAPCRTAVEIGEIQVKEGDGSLGTRPCAAITNGSLRATVNSAGVCRFYRGEQLLLQDYYRFYDGTLSQESCCLKLVHREWKGILAGSDYSLRVKFEAQPGEKLFGMGQYQQPNLDLKGCILELAQRNSQITVPFAVSSRGYGFLWNNPAVGQVTFGMNYTEWVALSTREMDYWITAGDSPRALLEAYTGVTGRAPMFPESLMGLWQCKLRYRTQEEVLEVARKYRDEGLPIDQIVIDFFHWTVQGDWKFDKTYWPDPKAMVEELHAMGVKVIVSVWPSVDRRSENFGPMLERGLLIRTERGALQTYDYQGDCVEIDAFNPEARAYIWEACKRNYADLGIDAFWLDNCEPDYGVYDFDHYRYVAGPALQVSNQYPQMLSRAFFEHMPAVQRGEAVNLLRCGWAGSQKYGNLIWSGDVPSTFASLRDQLQCGLNMGLAGIPWWTTDIGGFMTEDVNDPAFRQLLLRWFQFAVFSPVLRLHGDRGPYNIPPLDDRDWGGGYLHTGQPNEMWSYGEECYRIMKKFYVLRRSLRPYVAGLFREAHENGSPLLRTMFYEFPEDPVCWELTEQYMFGSRYLVAPILYPDVTRRQVYLPRGQWRCLEDGTLYEGGRRVEAEAPLEVLPVYEKMPE